MYLNFRPAVAMIELIFALVIMGIALMSAPQLVSQAQKSGYVATQQEAIAAVASHMSLILSRHWDEANTAQPRPVTILRTPNDVAIGLDPIPAGALAAGSRRGTPPTSTRPRTFLQATNPNPLNAGPILSEAGEANNDDIDDYDQTETTLALEAGAVAGNDDYIDRNFIMATRVHYVVDTPTNAGAFNTNANVLTYATPAGPAGNISNVKWVNIQLAPAAGTATELDKQMTLDAFSCNIGGFVLKEINL